MSDIDLWASHVRVMLSGSDVSIETGICFQNFKNSLFEDGEDSDIATPSQPVRA